MFHWKASEMRADSIRSNEQTLSPTMIVALIINDQNLLEFNELSNEY